MTVPVDLVREAARIVGLKAKLDSARPASGEALANLADWYDVQLTYTSNAIEGNTLTHSETAMVIEKGITVSGKPLIFHNEAIDHYAAYFAGTSLTTTAAGTCV